MPDLILLLAALYTMGISVKTSANQVTTPAVKSNLIMAFVRMVRKSGDYGKNKPITRLALQSAIIGINKQECRLTNWVFAIVPERLRNARSVLLPTVVRSFAGNGNVMRMVLRHTCRGDLNKPGFLELVDIFSAAVSHSRPESSYQLIQHFRHQAFERHAAGNAFGRRRQAIAPVASEGA